MKANPYAKKKHTATLESSAHQPERALPGATTSTSNNTRRADQTVPSEWKAPHRTTRFAVPPPVSTLAASSFSQAFESIEDTSIFHEQQHLWGGRTTLSSPNKGASERELQRALDTLDGSTATNETSSATVTNAEEGNASRVLGDSYPDVSDRDLQVLLQQPHVLYVSVKQRGNGVLNYIRNVPWQFQKMLPDYIFSSTTCALFLSIRYHLLYKEYIERRIAALRTDFTLRVLLVLVDVDDNQAVLLELNKLAVLTNFTLILAWTEEEAARYLETFKALHGKDAGSIQKNKETGNFADQVTDFLTTCKSINKTDAASVLTQFGNVRAALAATPDELALISGLGEVKVKRLYDAFHKPFSSKAARLRNAQRSEERHETEE